MSNYKITKKAIQNNLKEVRQLIKFNNDRYLITIHELLAECNEMARNITDGIFDLDRDEQIFIINEQKLIYNYIDEVRNLINM